MHYRIQEMAENKESRKQESWHSINLRNLTSQNPTSDALKFTQIWFLRSEAFSPSSFLCTTQIETRLIAIWCAHNILIFQAQTYPQIRCLGLEVFSYGSYLYTTEYKKWPRARNQDSKKVDIPLVWEIKNLTSLKTLPFTHSQIPNQDMAESKPLEHSM